MNPPVGWAANTRANVDKLEVALGRTVHLIVVDDGSQRRDELHELKRQMPRITLIHLPKNEGKGSALRKGFRHATTDVSLFTDADFPYEIGSMTAMVNVLESGADVALGHREHDYYASVPWFRKGLSEAFRFVLKSVLKFPVTDTQCGLKGMNAKGREVFLQTTVERFMVDMEFIKRAVRKGDLKIVPVVVKLRPKVTFSAMGAYVLLRELLNFVRVLLAKPR